MEVRSYYATSVEAAMELARRELGGEALLIQSKRSEPELAHLGRYEVVFAGELQVVKPHPLESAPVSPTARALPEVRVPDRVTSRVTPQIASRVTPRVTTASCG